MKVLNHGKALCGYKNIQTVKKGLCEYGKIYCRAVQGSEYGKKFGVAAQLSEKGRIAMLQSKNAYVVRPAVCQCI